MERQIAAKSSGAREADPLLAQNFTSLPRYAMSDELQEEASYAVTFIESSDDIDGMAFTPCNEDYQSGDSASLGIVGIGNVYCVAPPASNASAEVMEMKSEELASPMNMAWIAEGFRMAVPETAGAGMDSAAANVGSAASSTELLDYSSSSSRTSLKRHHEEDGVMVDVHSSKCSSMPQQVQDNEEVDLYKWHPVNESMHRIKMKIDVLNKAKTFQPTDVEPLLIAHGKNWLFYSVAYLLCQQNLHMFLRLASLQFN